MMRLSNKASEAMGNKKQAKLSTRIRKNLFRIKGRAETKDTASLHSESTLSQTLSNSENELDGSINSSDGGVRIAKLGAGQLKDNGALSMAMTTPEKDADDILVLPAPTTSDTSEPDIYGQIHPNETPELIAEKLVAFDNAVVALPPKKKTGLNQAMQKCPHLLDDAFKLMFLRCETFHEVPAAKRYAKYWDKRLEIFGPKAFQPLTQAEALSEDGAALAIGYATLNPALKDASGRNIVYMDVALQDLSAYSSKSMVRALWYYVHAALEDETTQRKGVIVLCDVSGTSMSKFDSECLKLISASLTACIPVRLSGIHALKPPRIFHAIFPLVKMLLGERLGKRLFLQSGDLVKQLHKFGITKANLPTDVGGDVVLDRKGWLVSRP